MSRFATVALVLGAVLTFGAVGVGAEAWQPSPGHTQLPLWSGAMPDSQPVRGAEDATPETWDHLVAGKSWTYVSNVSTPTITVYSPKGKNTGVAVVVFRAEAMTSWPSTSKAPRSATG